MNGSQRIAVLWWNGPTQGFMFFWMPEEKTFFHIGPKPVNHLWADTIKLPVEVGTEFVLYDFMFQDFEDFLGVWLQRQVQGSPN